MELNFPTDLKYTQTHEWVRIDGEMATIGISDYAQHKLGDIVYVDLPDVGSVLEKGSVAGEIESVKAVGDLFMPLTGNIIEINEKITTNPELVNNSPYVEGWMLKIKVSNLGEIDGLLSVENYKKLIEEEEE
jgi:glycine cleavage system H protein